MTPSSKTPQKPVVAKPARAAAAVATKAAPAKAVKPPGEAPRRREKLVRDSFTIPKGEYAVLDSLKQRAVGLARPAKKSELLRAGVKALAAMNDAALLAALQAVPAIKTGRPLADPPTPELAPELAPAPAPKARKARPASSAQPR